MKSAAIVALYLFELLFTVFFFAMQVLGRLLMLSGFFVPLALTLLAAELYNILAFHLTLAPASIRPARVACVLWVLVFLQYVTASTASSARSLRTRKA